MDTGVGNISASKSVAALRPDPNRGLKQAGFAFAGLVLGTVLAFARLPAMAQKTIWAEDGGVFLRDALATGWSGVFAPYEGYLHLIPRLAANTVVAALPVDHFALAMNVLSCLTVAAVAVLVFHLSGPFTDSTAVRLCWASATILVAPGPLETLGNFANVHWYFLWLTPWLLLKPAKSLHENLGLLAVAMLVSMTEIISVLFVPLFFYKMRDRAYWPARAGLVLGLTCQFSTTLTFPRSPSSGYPVNAVSIIEGWFLNSSSALVFGDSESIILNIHTFGAAPIVLAATPFLLLFVFTLKEGLPAHRLLAVVMLAASFASWAAAQVVNPQPFFDYSSFGREEWNTFFLSRYSTAPSLFLLALIPLAAAVVKARWKSVSAGLLGAFLVLQVVFFFPSGVARTDGPAWNEGVGHARQACEADPSLDSASVPIAPRGWFADKVEVACATLRSPK